MNAFLCKCCSICPLYSLSLHEICIVFDMKKIIKTFLFSIVVVTAMSVSSCMSTKKIVYMQGADTVYAIPQEIAQAFELKIQSDDELAISVTSKNAELIKPFDNNTLIGGGSGISRTGSSSTTQNTTSGVAYFLVDKKGNIEFPVFGTINTRNKSCKELALELQKRFINEGHIKDAVVNVKIMSFKVTVLGDVKNPGTQTFTGERLTLLEALGRSGDMNSSAKRENVLVMREEDGKRVTYQVNMCDAKSVFESPAYYLQQNDVVYVQPNKSVRVKGSTGYTLFQIGATAVSMLVSIVSLIIAITR